MASQQVSNKYLLRDSDRNALLVLLEDDASRAGFVADVAVPTIDDCDGDCTTKAVSTSETLASCAFTDRLRELSLATYGPSQYCVDDSSDTTRLLSRNRMSQNRISRIRDVTLVLQAEHSRWVTDNSLT